MDYNRSKPGPRATSCLTCRQRRKKCDLSRPHCDRCTKGSFKCLGYDDDTKPDHHCTARHSELRPILPALPELAKGEPWSCDQATWSDLPTTNAPCGYYSSEPFPLFKDPAPSIIGTGLLQLLALTETSPDDNDNQTLSKRTPGRPFDTLWPQDQSFCINQSPPSMCVTPGPTKSSAVRPDPTQLDIILESVCRSIPQTIDSSSSAKDGYVAYVLSDYAMQRVRKFFHPPPVPVRDRLVEGIKQSNTTIWVMYLGAKLFRALAETPRNTNIEVYVHWIGQFDQQIAKASQRDTSVDQMRDQLSAQLELTFLRFVTGDSRAGYFAFQKCLPSFLNLVSRHPDLFMEHRSNLLVSFARALSAPWYDIPRFVMYDMTIALVLGIPPLVQYGFDRSDERTRDRTSLDWVHGISIELLSSAAQVNAWRSGARDTVRDWKALEEQTLGWMAEEATSEEGENLVVEGIARLAIQEGWRHVVLIYLYMGMCNVSSHDPRVQSSVRQIAKLVQVASHSPLDVHTFVHCVVAGLAAKYERQRAVFRAKLLSFQDTRVWLFRGIAFSKVLEHLWHNAGKDGGPVTWDDYVHSRCTVVPL